MRLISDYHTHSKYSRFFHGKNSIMEMAISANSMGLSEIGITDHGFKHLFRTNKAKLKRARAEINEINSWSNTKVLLGVEADIISEDGLIDVDNETLAMLDILIVGYHRMIKTDFAGYFGNVANTEEARKRCTRAFINAINKNPVTIVSHLDSVLKTDLYEIGCACRDKNVLVEINSRHNNWTQEQVDALVDSGCLFVVSSDAHKRDDVGRVENAFDIIRKYNIPTEYVINVEFDDNEKSEEHRDADYYYSIYKQKQEERQEKIAEAEQKKKTEFTESLSDEMEKALKEIAEEKGINYTKPEREKVEDEQSDFVGSYNFFEDDDILERARAHIEKLERMERESSLGDNTEYTEIEEEKSENPVVEALRDFNEVPRPMQKINEQTQNVVEENTLENTSAQKVEKTPVKIVDTTMSNNFGSLNSVINEIKGTNVKEERKEEEVVVEKTEEESKKRKSFGGFVGAGGIIGTAESNKSSKTDE